LASEALVRIDLRRNPGSRELGCKPRADSSSIAG
jgi:hypothetical protein